MTARAGRNLTLNSDQGGVVLVTMTSADVSPSSQPCLECLVQRQTGSTAIYMNIDAAATSSKWLLVGADYVPVKIANLNQLHFISTSTDVVQILFRC